MTTKILILKYPTRIVVLRLLVVFSLLMSFSVPSSARQLDNVSLPDSITIDGTSIPLQLNGMGYRTKFFFDIYVAGFYTESKVITRDAAQALTGPKRFLMHMVYDDVSQQKMADAWREGFEENNSDAQLEKLNSRLLTLISYFPDLIKDDVVLLDYIPSSGTRVTINDEVKGVIAGVDFYIALLDVWLGGEPADDDLKDALLGVVDN